MPDLLKRSAFICLLILCLCAAGAQAADPGFSNDRLIGDMLAAAENETAFTQEYTLFSDLPDGRGPDMRYDSISFTNAWPEAIREDMEACFGTVQPICGVYYLWHHLAGSIRIVFFAYQEADRTVLAGAEQRGDAWKPEIISDSFLPPAYPFTIGMMPELRMDESVLCFSPAVIHGSEWFDFMPTAWGFQLDRYETILDARGNLRLIINAFPSVSGWSFESYYLQDGEQFDIATYEADADSFDPKTISAIDFPKTPEELLELTGPNG